MPRGYPDWLAKQLEIWSKAEWSIIKGEWKVFSVSTGVPPGEAVAVSVYVVPSGKSLFITDATFMRYTDVGTIVFSMLKKVGEEMYDIAATGGMQGGALHFRQPAFLDEGDELLVSLRNVEATYSAMYAVVNAYEITK